MYDIFENEIANIVRPEQIKKNEPLAAHTTFRIGGPADFLIIPKKAEEIGQILSLCVKEDIPYYVLGNGSNVLVADEGYRGVVLCIGSGMADCKFVEEADKVHVTAGAGIMLSKLANEVANQGLTGFEFAAGIPGTLGGAVMMNAGAYGGEMKDIITAVQLMDADGNLLEKTCEEMDFSYRHSIVEEQKLLVLGATLTLEKGEKEVIEEKMKELAVARKTKQPLEFPSAGSTFKRPEGYFAGKLIMDAGLRGYQVGGAQVSEKHCGFVINKGNATAKDVLQLVSDVKEKVYDAFQVELEPEVRLVGRK